MFGLTPWKRKTHGGDGGEAIASTTCHPLSRLRDQFDTLWENYVSQWPGLWEDALASHRWWGWEVDDREDEILVRAEAPGFEAGDFDVKLSGNRLIVAASRQEPQTGEAPSEGTRRAIRLHRMVTLPAGILEEQIEARYHSGVLEIRIPKGEEARGKRIPVNAG